MLKRMYNTELSDDTLLLFDAMFDCYVPMHMLYRDVFGEMFNLPYTHQLNNNALEALLSELVNRKWLQVNTSTALQKDKILFYTLSEIAGALWEMERRPNWDCYCSDSYQPIESSQRCLMNVQSPSQITAQKFLAAKQGVIRGTPESKRYEHYQLLPWKTFPVVYEITVELKEIGEPQTGQWWQSVSNLISLAD